MTWGKNALPRPWRYVLILLAGWTAAVAIILTWELYDEHIQMLDVARSEARGMLTRERRFIRWSAERGGVYVPLDTRSRRDQGAGKATRTEVATPSGQRLMLLDTTHLIGELRGMADGEDGRRVRVTSLSGLSSADKPDEWEKEALRALGRGETEVSSPETMHGQEYLRLMQAIVLVKDTASGTGSRGGEKEHVPGGISVAMPLGALQAEAKAAMHRALWSYGSIWFLGLLGLVGGGWHLKQQIRHRQRAEEAMEATRVRVQEIAANLPGVVYQFLLHPDGTYTFPYVSSGIVSLLGITPEDVQKDPAALFPGMLHEEDVAAVFQSVFDSASQMTTWHHELQCRTKAGEMKWVRAISQPHAMPDGSVLWDGVLVDVSDRKQVEIQLQETQRVLEQRVAERTAELAEANQELEREIAERVKAERWLLESEERFRSYFELGLIGMAIVSPERDWIEVNERLSKMLAYTELELIATPWTELVHPEDRAADEDNYQRVISGAAKGYSTDIRLLRRDGRTVYAHLSVRCLHRPDGSVDSLIVLVQDITDRKLAEQALKDSQAFLQTVIDAIPDVMMVIDREYQIVMANRAARERAGGVDPVSRCLACYRFSHHRDLPCSGEMAPCPLREVLATHNPVTVTHVHYGANEETQIVEVSAAPIFDDAGEVIQIIESCRDVTDRKRAEEALRQREEQYRQIFQSVTDGLLVFSLDGAVVEANHAACQLHQYSHDELIGLSAKDLMQSDGLQRFEGCQKQLETAGCFFTESVHVRKDGSAFSAEVRVATFNFKGQPHLLAVIHDITDRKQAEAEAQRAQQRLLDREHQEKERVEAELARARHQLVRQTRLATLGHLATSIAHSLRNPLGVVRNAAFYLKRKAPPEEPKWREYLCLIEREMAVAAQIITELLTLSQDKGPAKKPEAFGPIVTEARSHLPESDTVQWQVHCEPDPFIVDVDAAQFEQVLRNLFANAMEAMGDAGGSVSIEARRAAEGDEIVVCNTGAGIPADRRELIFEPLVSTKHKGTGLGLTICRQIVERHGGTIEAENPPAGAAFRIRLPREEPRP